MVALGNNIFIPETLLFHSSNIFCDYAFCVAITASETLFTLYSLLHFERVDLNVSNSHNYLEACLVSEVSDQAGQHGGGPTEGVTRKQMRLVFLGRDPKYEDE